MVSYDKIKNKMVFLKYINLLLTTQSPNWW
jgi:hypothetical protein